MNNTSLHQLKQVKDQLEAYNSKVGLITFRKKLLEDQTRHHYSMEYDKIRGLLKKLVFAFQNSSRPYE